MKFTFGNNFKHEIIKSLTQDELVSLSVSIRNEIIDKCSRFGGHLSSNLGVVDLTIALFKSFNFPTDKVIYDVGHQCYAHKLLSGRSLNNLRQKNGISGFPKREESIYDCYETGHSSTSISAAMGLALTRDLNKENYEIIAVIGDGSIVNGLALEALNCLESFNHKIIIILNDNNMSIAETVGAIQKTSDNSVFKQLGLDFIDNVDGHNFKELDKAFKLAKKSSKSVIIRIKTTKGKGYKFAENDEVGLWHSVSKFDINTGLSIENKTTWSDIYASLLYDIMRDDKNITIAPATAIGSSLNQILKDYPTRAFNVGIAEEHAVTLASGIASNNFHPYVSIYSTFLQRAYDQLNHDIARTNLPVTFLIDRVGLVGNDGQTHQGIFDLAMLYSLPNMAVAMAKDSNQAGELMRISTEIMVPFAIRYPKGSATINNNHTPLKYGDWQYDKTSDSKFIAVVSYGPKLIELEEKFKDYDISIVNAIFQKPLNKDFLNDLLSYQNIIIYDPYSIKDGFALNMLNNLNELNYGGKVKVITLKDKFTSHASVKQQEEENQVDIESILNTVKEVMLWK